MSLESLDVLFFADRILGTTEVPYIFIIFHLWVRVKCFNVLDDMFFIV